MDKDLRQPPHVPVTQQVSQSVYQRPRTCRNKSRGKCLNQCQCKSQQVPQSPQVEALEEGEIPGIQYNSLEELLANVGVCYPCPIHKVAMQELKSIKEWCQDVFLRCNCFNCPVFTSLKDYSVYFDACRLQGNDWFTLERIELMKCECGQTPTLALSKSEKN